MTKPINKSVIGYSTINGAGSATKKSESSYNQLNTDKLFFHSEMGIHSHLQHDDRQDNASFEDTKLLIEQTFTIGLNDKAFSLLIWVSGCKFAGKIMHQFVNPSHSTTALMHVRSFLNQGASVSALVLTMN
ncbi:hypothetical protein ACSLBF_06790 [Pseudoalteromonas sp. T1lg65]|uniref:hypothetical protein n=1 Tax=Pseudoalteromonas sp. T1lg65 TaxID=2077101 RepID=UPI003F7B2DC6